MNEIVKSNEQTAVISMIERVALDKDADISKLEKMIDMQERILDRNAKQSFMADFAMMQTALPRVAEKGKSNNGKYALLEDINDTVRPAMQQFGFAVSFRIQQSDPKFMTISGILAHKNGHSEETSMVLPVDTSGSKNATQSIGSTTSYGKRYVICALLNISTGNDDDGGAPKKPPSAPPRPVKQPITAARLAAAIVKINDKEYSKKSLLERFDLTEEQLGILNRELKDD